MSLFEMLPCLRCGEWAVPVSLIFGINRRETNACLRCDCEHFLEIKPQENRYDICYQRYTLGYPLEFYDEGVLIPAVHAFASDPAGEEDACEAYSGPVIVYPRKRRFRKPEVQAIWRATEGACHLCGRHWTLMQRGKYGWHIDHVIPHIGGGRETETPANMRVACWRCNLSKGRGYTEKQVRASLQRLIERLDAGRQRSVEKHANAKRAEFAVGPRRKAHGRRKVRKLSARRVMVPVQGS